MRDFKGAREDGPDDGGEAWDVDDEDFEEEDLDELDFDHEDPDFGHEGPDFDDDPDGEDELDEDEDLDGEDEDLDEDLDEAGLDLDELDSELLELDSDEGSELAGTVDVSCPYCGAGVEMIVDAVGGDVQEYVEDCEVCCQPWSVRVTLDRDGSASVELGTLE